MNEIFQRDTEKSVPQKEFKKEAARAGKNGVTPVADELAKLLPVVPLVKVAWAEGRVTKRERQLILKVAERFGVEPESAAFQRLNDWLELHPTDDFYNESLELLSTNLRNLPPEDRALLKLDLLSDCALVAEASGGERAFVGGGRRICDEEIAVVKAIAQKLSDRHGAVAA